MARNTGASFVAEAGARPPFPQKVVVHGVHPMPEPILAAILRAPIVSTFLSANIIRHPEVVERDTRPYWQQRGWTRVLRQYNGWYRTEYGSWQGRASKTFLGEYELFIRDPPDALQRHSHWACFRPTDDGWYFIHIVGGDLRDLSSGILRVEQILSEAHRK